MLNKARSISNLDVNKALELYNQCCSHNKDYPKKIYNIIETLSLNYISFIAVLLHHIQYDSNLKKDKHHFNDDILYLVDMMGKLSNIYNKSYCIQYFYFNKLVSTVNHKLREIVVLTFLVPVLHQVIDDDSRSPHIAEMINNCYIPYFLSHREYTDLAYILQDLCFKIQYPEARNRILGYMHCLYPDMDNIIHNIEQQLRNIFGILNIQASLSYRIKSPHSIWIKTFVKDIDITALHDILAFRVIVPNKKACYDVSKLIHLHYNTITSQFVDYIRYPKNNGYQSIHIVISGGNKGNIELQIRSTTMHRQTQYGSAHHTYKANKYYVSRTNNNVNIIIFNITLSYSNGIPSVYISMITITNTINNNLLYTYNSIPSFIHTQHSTNFVVNNTTTSTLSCTTTTEYITYYNNLSLFIKDINSDTIHHYFSLNINLNLSNIRECKLVPLVFINITYKPILAECAVPTNITYRTKHADSNVRSKYKLPLQKIDIINASYNISLGSINNKVVLEQNSQKKFLTNTINTCNTPIIRILDLLVYPTEMKNRISNISADDKDILISYTFKFNCSELVPLLIAHGADINTKNNSGDTVLHSAAGLDNLDLAKLLIAHGADVNAKNNSGDTVLHSAAGLDNLDLAKLLIAHGADVNAKNNLGQTVLYYTISEDSNLKLVPLLITHGADVNTRTNNGKTVLHLAAESGNSELVYWLIHSGADINTKTNDGTTVLHFAAGSGNSNLVYWLIRSGADINTKTNDGDTVLHLAAESGNSDLVYWLIHSGANVNAKTNDGDTPLHCAIWSNNLDLVYWLIRSGADVNAKNNSGATPLHCTAEYGNLDLIKLLITHGADVNAKTNDDDTVLHLAVYDRSIKVISELIGHGADVNAKTNDGATPLHCAIWSNNLDIVYWLIRSGADANAKNNSDETALHHALEYNKYKIIPFLMSHTKDLDTYDHSILHRVECTILNEPNLLGENLTSNV